MYRNLKFAVTNVMEETALWEADAHSRGQQIARFLWHPKIHYSEIWDLQDRDFKDCLVGRHTM
jgi:hypothetical protein